MSEHSYTVLFEPAEEGGYVAFCAALPGPVTEGDTYEEVRERVKEALPFHGTDLKRRTLTSIIDQGRFLDRRVPSPDVIVR